MLHTKVLSFWDVSPCVCDIELCFYRKTIRNSVSREPVFVCGSACEVKNCYFTSLWDIYYSKYKWCPVSFGQLVSCSYATKQLGVCPFRAWDHHGNPAWLAPFRRLFVASGDVGCCTIQREESFHYALSWGMCAAAVNVQSQVSSVATEHGQVSCFLS